MANTFNSSVNLDAVPIEPPPPGVIPNFINPPSHGSQVIIAAAICLSVMIPAVLMRVYTRVFISHSLGWDDYASVLGAMSAIVFAAFIMLMLNFGFGRHNWDVSVAMFGSGGSKYVLLTNIVAGITFFFIKLSILLLYLRIFSLNLRTRYFIYFGVSAIFVFTVVSTILYGVLCVPHKHESWQETSASPRCSSSQEGLETANGVFNAVSDIYILLLPLPSIWRLQLPMRKKTGLIATFLTGLLACSCSLTSLGIRIKYLRIGDFTWNVSPILYTTIIEQNVGIICSCMPACKLFFRRYFPEPIHIPSAGSLRNRLLSRTKYSTEKLLSADSANPQNHSYLPGSTSLELGERLEGQVHSKGGSQPSFPEMESNLVGIAI